MPKWTLKCAEFTKQVKKECKNYINKNEIIVCTWTWMCGVLVKALPHKQRVQGSNPLGTFYLCAGIVKVARYVGRLPRWPCHTSRLHFFGCHVSFLSNVTCQFLCGQLNWKKYIFKKKLKIFKKINKNININKKINIFFLNNYSNQQK